MHQRATWSSYLVCMVYNGTRGLTTTKTHTHWHSLYSACESHGRINLKYVFVWAHWTRKMPKSKKNCTVGFYEQSLCASYSGSHLSGDVMISGVCVYNPCGTNVRSLRTHGTQNSWRRDDDYPRKRVKKARSNDSKKIECAYKTTVHSQRRTRNSSQANGESCVGKELRFRRRWWWCW